jgi:hypothetical protein
MERVRIVGLLLSSLGVMGLAGFAVSPASGEYPKLKYSVYPAQGTYSVQAEVQGFCSATCVVLLFDGKRIRVENPRQVVRVVGTGRILLSVNGSTRPTIVGWKPQ